jgi:hypothetical protein
LANQTSDPRPAYRRPTIIAAADMLKALGHSGFNRFLLELELPDDRIGEGTGLMDRATSLATYAFANPDRPTPDRQTVVEAIVDRASQLWRGGSLTNLNRGEPERFAEAMQREGRPLLEHAAGPQGMDRSGGAATPADTARALKTPPPMALPRKVFIVHGHDKWVREAVARFLTQIDFEAVILDEQANGGRTIIEKFEQQDGIGFAVVLLTPDDVGSKLGGTLAPRARQNVVFELGFFVGRLGRGRVYALRRGEVETPSDFAGVVYGTFDEHEGWKRSLVKELEQAGFEIDHRKANK